MAQWTETSSAVWSRVRNPRRRRPRCRPCNAVARAFSNLADPRPPTGSIWWKRRSRQTGPQSNCRCRRWRRRHRRCCPRRQPARHLHRHMHQRRRRPEDCPGNGIRSEHRPASRMPPTGRFRCRYRAERRLASPPSLPLLRAVRAASPPAKCRNALLPRPCRHRPGPRRRRHRDRPPSMRRSRSPHAAPGSFVSSSPGWNPGPRLSCARATAIAMHLHLQSLRRH